MKHEETLDYEEQFKRLWQSLVPDKGEASTVQGEMVRAIGRLLLECEDNGNINWDEDDYYQSLTDFLELHLCDVEFIGKEDLTWVKELLARARDYESCDADALLHLQSVIIDWCKEHPNPVLRVSKPG